MPKTPKRIADPQDQAEVGKGYTPDQTDRLTKLVRGIGKSERPDYRGAAGYALLPEEVSASSEIVAVNRAAAERHARQPGTVSPDAAIAALDAAIAKAGIVYASSSNQNGDRRDLVGPGGQPLGSYSAFEAWNVIYSPIAADGVLDAFRAACAADLAKAA